ncbi:YrhK family protein [Planococcus lenghuensis]|uniref:YrhK domain-containing protein n=1 Tax=Planococcus lenghuensis TaxID=2213202 RepID=A0A1Q2KVX4_9BACL|nr:YrhK family protein [Planococcus lenghuensis]AQQ52350.1 hypothetical protein B0X71_03975 [Planococcus lenghuensis]
MLSIKHNQDYVEIQTAASRILFRKECKLTTTFNDLLVAFFFVAGSLINFFSSEGGYANTLYLFGSLILAGRALYNVKTNLSIEHTRKTAGHWK